jgi:hypothetical protein
MSEPVVEVVSEPASTEPVVTETVTPEAVPAATWRDDFDEGLRDNPSITKFENAGELAKGYVEVSSLIGKKGLIQPDENSTPEQVGEFYTALGRPESAAGYEVDAYQPPEAIAEVWDTNGVGEISKRAYELGVTKEQFGGLMDALAQQQAQNLGEHIQGLEQNRETVSSELSTEWGTATPEKMALAKRGFTAAAEAAGIDKEELAGQLLPDGGLIGDNAALTRIFAAIGEGGGELGFHGGKNSRITMTPDEARIEANTLMASEAMHDRSNPEHKIAVDRHTALLKMAYPEGT